MSELKESESHQENRLTRVFRRLSTVVTTRLRPKTPTPTDPQRTPLRSPPRRGDSGPPAPVAPAKWGEFRLLEEVGKGAFGNVYRAWEEGLDREVALKLVPTERAGSGPASSLLHEAQLLARVSHPNVMTVHGARRIGDFVGIWSEFLAGNTLAQIVERDGPMRAEEATIVGIDLCRAIAAVHQAGLVHRDVKAENVLRQAGGRIVLVDFGTGQTLDATEDSEEISGTPLYMAPEVLEGDPPTVRSDLYSIGVLLFFLVTGRFPVRERTTDELREAHRDGRRLLLRDARADLPAGFVRVVERALARNPDDRFATAGALEHELSRAMGLDAVDRGAPHKGPWFRWALGAAVLAAVGLVLWIARTLPVSPRPPPFSLAVLPVENLSDEPENDALGAGITDILTADLAAVPGLLVVREASAAPDSRQAAAKLGVSHVVFGSLQRSGSDVRVALHLTAQNDSEVLWSRVFDGSMAELFGLERRIATALLGALAERGVVRSQDTLFEAARETTVDAEAFEEYSRARLLLDRSDKPENLREATALLESAIERDSSFALAHAALAEALWLRYRDRLEEESAARAQAEALEALRLNPSLPGVRLSLALVYQGTGRTDEALAELERLLDRQPASDEAHRMVGRIHAARGNLEGAVESIAKAIALRPDFGPNHAALGLVYFRAGKYPEAIASFQRLTALEPDGDRGFQMLGTAFHAAGDLDNAASNYERALALAPSATAQSNVGMIYYSQGRFADARAAFEASDRLRPGVAATKRNQGDALRRLGEDAGADDAYASAIELTKRDLGVNPDDAQAMALQGLLEAKLGRHPEAERLLARSLELAPNDNEVLYKRAAALALAGRSTEALAALESALENGYSTFLVELDDDLDSLRSAPEFHEMLRRAR